MDLTVFSSGVIFSPFNEHQDAKVSEKENQKDDLWHKLDEDIHIAAKETKIKDKNSTRHYGIIIFQHLSSIPMIPNAKDNSKTHVNNAKNDGNLHFVGVKVRNLILSHHPDGIDTKRIRCLPIMVIGLIWNQHSRVMMLQLMVSQVDLVSRSKYVDTFRENVVIDESGINRE